MGIGVMGKKKPRTKRGYEEIEDNINRSELLTDMTVSLMRMIIN